MCFVHVHFHFYFHFFFVHWTVFFGQPKKIHNGFFLFFFVFRFDLIVGNEKPQRRGSVGSLDSGMSISYTSSSGSRDTAKRLMQQPFQVCICKQRSQVFIRESVHLLIDYFFVLLFSGANSTESRHFECNEQRNITITVGLWWYWYYSCCSEWFSCCRQFNSRSTGIFWRHFQSTRTQTIQIRWEWQHCIIISRFNSTNKYWSFDGSLNTQICKPFVPSPSSTISSPAKVTNTMCHHKLRTSHA